MRALWRVVCYNNKTNAYSSLLGGNQPTNGLARCHVSSSDKPDLSSERAHHMDKQEETSCHEPQPGLDTHTDRLTDRQSQCDFYFDLLILSEL
jgi:hypothetical protein